MAVLLETSKGDIVIDLFVDDAPDTCKNFLKLCKVKYYNNCLFHNVQRNFIAQTGDPTGTGKGGDSVYGLMYGSQARFFEDEITPRRKHQKRGTVGMASAGPHLNASQFYITLADSLDSLDEKHTVFGVVSEGLEVLEAMNEVPVDEKGRPLQNIRIRHTISLEDPFDDPPQLAELIPDASPPPTFEHGDRLEEDWVPVEDTRPQEEIEKEARAAEATNRAVVLEMIGDLPEAEVKPPSNMLFVCKLNPVTTEEDLEIIFSRFGNVTSCDIIRDYKTGDSLCYAFIGYDDDAACEAAYFKMNNVLIDDRRIRVDFSQSVSHIWRQFRRHGKKGGTADMAAEAAGYDRDTAGGGARGGRGRAMGGGTSTQVARQQQGDRGLLFDHHADVQQQQKQQQYERAAALVVRQRDDRGVHQRGWDQPAAAAGVGGYGRSSKRSRSRSRSLSSSRSRSRDRGSSGKKHKKHKKEKHKKEKHKHHSRERSQERAAAGGGGGGGSGARQLEQQQHHSSREDDRQYRDGRRGERAAHDSRDRPSRDDRDSRDRGYSNRQGRSAEARHTDRQYEDERNRGRGYDDSQRDRHGRDGRSSREGERWDYRGSSRH